MENNKAGHLEGGAKPEFSEPTTREAKSEFFESLHRAREETKIRIFRSLPSCAWDSHQDGRMNGSPGVSKTPGGSLIPPRSQKAATSFRSRRRMTQGRGRPHHLQAEGRRSDASLMEFSGIASCTFVHTKMSSARYRGNSRDSGTG